VPELKKCNQNQTGNGKYKNSQKIIFVKEAWSQLFLFTKALFLHPFLNVFTNGSLQNSHLFVAL
jgi:hypothetical protein